MDYAVLPPEINSGQMYAGTGSASLVASAAAWQALAAELGIAGGSFDAVVTALASGPWLGPSSMAMLSAALPYVTWMMTTAAQAEEAAVLAGQAAMAFETARASVIPPPVIAENRVRLATLVATNFMGVNTPAIAATEAEYDEFWAQDASTMYGFASQAAGITGALVPFIPPAMTTNPAGLAAQAAAVGESTAQSAGQAGSNVSGVMGQITGLPGGVSATSMLSMGPQMLGMIPQVLQGLTSPLSGMGQLLSPLSSGLGQFQSLLSPFMGGMLPVLNGLGPAASSLGSLGSLGGSAGNLPGFGGMPMAGMGQSTSLPGMGPRLSVPTSWTENSGGAANTPKLVGAAPPGETPNTAAPQGGMVPASAMGNAASGGGPSGSYPLNMMGGMNPREATPASDKLRSRVTNKLVY